MSRKLKVFDKFSENVHLAWVYPGLSPKVVSSWSDFDGVVLAATGLGNAPVASDDPKSPRSILPAIRELIEVLWAAAVAFSDGQSRGEASLKRPPYPISQPQNWMTIVMRRHFLLRIERRSLLVLAIALLGVWWNVACTAGGETQAANTDWAGGAQIEPAIRMTDNPRFRSWREARSPCSGRDAPE